MTPENFCYWLQGLLEVGDPKRLNYHQIQQIKDHLQLVFKKETPVVPKGLKHVNRNDDIFNNYVPCSDFSIPPYTRYMCSDGNPPASC